MTTKTKLSPTQARYLDAIAASAVRVGGRVLEGHMSAPQPRMRSRRTIDALIRLELVEEVTQPGHVLVRLTDAGRAWLDAREPHAGSVLPWNDDADAYTWVCVCGARPDPATSWRSFDGASVALRRHITTKTLAAGA